MNNAPLTLILIASLGIVAVISLGVFFALRPKGIIEETTYPASSGTGADYPQQQIANVDVAPVFEKSKDVGGSFNVPTTVQPPPIVSNAQGARVNSPKIQIQTASGHVVDVPSPAISSPSFRSPGVQQATVSDTSEPTASTVEILDPLRAVDAKNEMEPVQNVVQTVDSDPAAGTNFRELKVNIEKDMHSYGKIVGLAFHNHKLYVPSYQTGNISVFSTPDLKFEAEFRCPGCHIYDIGITTAGDIIVAEGKNSKLARIDKNGTLVNEVKVPYSTKGIAVSQYDEIFVLPKSHENIYVYDTKLNELGVIPIPKTDTPSDCNFVDYRDDTIYVSCEVALYAFDVQGKLLRTMKPSKGTYAVGVTVDDQNLAIVGLRGVTAMDVFDKSGKLKETMGESHDSLWSDIVAGDGYVYVVDYISVTIKSYKYRN